MPKTKEGYGQNPRTDFCTYYIEDNSGCRIWRGGKNKKGQGVVRYNGKNRITSRVAWEIAFGPIPESKWMLHKCDKPACINPDHLFLGTASDNVQDMISKGRAPHQNRPKRIPDCHPNNRYGGNGLCYPCYLKKYYWDHKNA